MKWKDLYFATEVSDKIQYLVCQQAKEYNMVRHCETMHREKYDAYAGKLETIKLWNLNQHYANKDVSLPMFVSQAKIQ